MLRLLQITAALLLVTGCEEADFQAVEPPYKVGLNFMRTVPDTQYADADGVLDDLVAHGAQGFRQVQGADVSWFTLYQGGGYDDPNNYDFTEADAFLLNDHGLAPIPTLFQLGPSVAARAFGEDCPEDGASESNYCRQPQTPEGEVLDLSDETVLAQTKGYLRAVANHYAGTPVRFFEVLNEPARYAHYDLGYDYGYNYSPERYVELVALTEEIFEAADPDFRIVQGGMVYYDNHGADDRQEVWEDFFDKVLQEGGANHFDAVNFHFYGDMDDLDVHIGEIQELMEKRGADHLPLWMTEVGSSATALGEERQASDLAKSFTIAFCNGVELVGWHTHLSSSDGTEGWGGYGLRTAAGNPYASLSTFEAYSSRLATHDRCEVLVDTRDVSAYQFQGDAMGTAIVAWSTADEGLLNLGSFTDWSDVSITPLIPDDDGNMTATSQSAGTPVTLDRSPVLIEKN